MVDQSVSERTTIWGKALKYSSERKKPLYTAHASTRGPLEISTPSNQLTTTRHELPNPHLAVNGTRFPVNGNVQIMRPAGVANKGRRWYASPPWPAFDSVIASLVCDTPDRRARA